MPSIMPWLPQPKTCHIPPVTPAHCISMFNSPLQLRGQEGSKGQLTTRHDDILATRIILVRQEGPRKADSNWNCSL